MSEDLDGLHLPMMDIEYYLQAVGSSLEGPQHH